MSVFKAFPGSIKPAFKREEFWKHSICVGIIASAIYDCYEKTRGPSITKDKIHLAGLLHDLGKIILENYLPEDFHSAIKMAKRENISLYEAEWASYELAHDEIGCWLADKWRLPWDLTAVMRFHHNVLNAPEEHQSLVNIIHLADYLCLIQQLGDSGNPKPVYVPEIQEGLGLDLTNLTPIMERVKEEIKKSAMLFCLLD